jgi:hypothetical protein
VACGSLVRGVVGRYGLLLGAKQVAHEIFLLEGIIWLVLASGSWLRGRLLEALVQRILLDVLLEVCGVRLHSEFHHPLRGVELLLLLCSGSRPLLTVALFLFTT